MKSGLVHLTITLLVLASSACASAAEPGAAAPNSKPLPTAQQARLIEGYGKLPLSFEANQGQTDPQVKFLSRGDGYSLFLTQTEAVLSLQGKSCSQPLKGAAAFATPKPRTCESASPDSVLRMKLLGSNPDARISGAEELPGKSNYFMGQDSSEWRSNISNYRKVEYRDVYPGVDLVYYGNQRQLEHDFIVAPGADPKAIRLNFTGARRLSIDHEGNLKLVTSSGVTQLNRPVIYQEIAGVRQAVSGRYIKTNDNEIGFSIGDYDRKQKLVIDPILAYSTFFGGSLRDSYVTGIAADPEGNAYVTGKTQSTDFPLANPIFYSPAKNSLIGFVSKISADGQTLIYSTYLGDPSVETDCRGIAVDGSGSAYVTGYTGSQAFPVVNALQPKKGGQIDAFVTKLNPAGSALEYSTYLGGGKEDYAYAIAVDSSGAAYVTGTTTSSKFPTVNAFSTVGEVFVAKLSPAGSSLAYSTRLGGNVANEVEAAFAIAVDGLGEAIVTGTTNAADFPLKNPLFSTLDTSPYTCGTGGVAGNATVFVTKLSSTGRDLVFSTLIGKGAGQGIATNASGDAFLTGYGSAQQRFTTPQSLPSTNCFGTFVTRLKADGSAFVYSTYLGSASFSAGTSIAADADGNAYVSGYTTSGLPVVAAIQSQLGSAGQYPGPDAFLTKFNPSGSALIYSTYLGGSDQDYGEGVAIDGKGHVFVAGQTGSYNFPLKSALVPKFGGSFFDGFISNIYETPKHFSIANRADDTVEPGGQLLDDITVTNTGLTNAGGIVTVTSQREFIHRCEIPCTISPDRGQATFAIPVLPPGSIYPIRITTTVAKSAGDYNLVTNTATISSGPPFNEVDSATATTTVREIAPLYVRSNLVDSTNGLLHYVDTVTNQGGDNAHAVLLLDPLPAHTSFVSASTTLGACSLHPTIGANGAVRCTLNNPVAFSTVQVDIVLQASSEACPSVTNTVTVTSKSISFYTNIGENVVSVTDQLPPNFCATQAVSKIR